MPPPPFSRKNTPTAREGFTSARQSSRVEAVVVKHDWDALPNARSCIFLHIWRGAHFGTAGCTAMPPDQMEEIDHWLDRRKQPLFVQLPARIYERMRSRWRLPAVECGERDLIVRHGAAESWLTPPGGRRM